MNFLKVNEFSDELLDVSLALAEDACNQVAKGENENFNWLFLETKSKVFEKAGRLTEAAACLEEAIAVVPKSVSELRIKKMREKLEAFCP